MGKPAADFSFIRYANCWEDPALLVAALQPGPGRRILSVASGGDNSLLLLAGGAEVVAADLNPSQLACTELKCEALRRLEHPELLAFLGVRPSTRRRETAARLLLGVSPAARAFWAANGAAIEGGIVHAGKFERYFHLFRTWVLPLIHGRGLVAELLRPKTAEERRRFYETRWANRRWFLLFRLFFGRRALGRLGRDPAFFRYVDVPVAERILRRTEHALTALDTSSNPWLGYILEGNFTRALPPYLEPATCERVRANLDGLTLRLGGVDEVAAADDRGFDGFNLSDIFEYLSPAQCERVYAGLLARANPGARFAYWNMLAPRQAPESLAGRVTRRDEVGARLLLQDRAFFYSRFVVEEARG